MFVTIYNKVTGEKRRVRPPTARYVVERQPDWTRTKPDIHPGELSIEDETKPETKRRGRPRKNDNDNS